MDDVVEAFAKGICAEKCADFGDPPCWKLEGEWPANGCECLHEARHGFTTLSEAGYVVVPEDALTAIKHGVGWTLNGTTYTRAPEIARAALKGGDNE